MFIISFFTVSFCIFSSANARYRSLQVERAILNATFEGYDKRIRPASENHTGPVKVEINTFVRSINNIDDVNMVYDVQLTFRQSWIDHRLGYAATRENPEYVTLTDPDMLWTPDIFFSNEQTGHFHNMLLPNVLIRIFPNGRILYSTRISLHLFCPMNLKYYPLDSQTCNIRAASYGYTTQDIEFVWKEKDPIQINKNLMLSKFELKSFDTFYCTSKTNTGEYSCLGLAFQFSRNFYYYLMQVYMPTSFMVLLSWLVFWVSPKYSAVRFGLLIGVLMCSILINTSINTRTPQVSYTKAIDVWMGVCVCFIFGGMLELCLVIDAYNKEEHLRLQNQSAEDGASEKNLIRIDDGGKSNHAHKLKSPPFKWLNNYSTNAQRIDVFARLMFPTAFAFFNFVYWLTYATSD